MYLQKTKKIFISVFVIYAILVASHEGEFWPFSIYQMFSEGGKDWSKSLLLDLPEEECSIAAFESLEELSEYAIALIPHSVSQSDLSNYVKRARYWDDPTISGLQSLISNVIDENSVCLVNIRTGLRDNIMVSEIRPLLWVSKEMVVQYQEPRWQL